MRTKLHSHVDTPTMKCFNLKRAMPYICDIKFVTLQARENEISLRKWPGGTTQLRTSKGTLLPAAMRS